MNTKYLFVCLLVLEVGLAFAGGVDQRIQNANALISAELESEPKKISLNQDYLIVAQPGGKQHKLPVILVMRVYKCKVLQVREGKSSQREQRLYSFEIHSVDKKKLFAWNICSARPLGMFRLFSNERGENFLVWVDGRIMYFVQIAKPRDRLVAITDAVASGGARSSAIVRVPTHTLIPRKYHHPEDRYASAFYTEFLVEALHVGEKGNISVKVVSPRAAKVFTLVFDGKEWRKE